MSKLNEKIVAVQAKLKAPKNQVNTFGKYNYRSCEDILEAVKPLLTEHGLSLTLNDDVVLIAENRVYLKTTAVVSDGVDSIATTAFAREPDSRKGMDESQITGAASSYARKYALNGLFAIDDTKDQDSKQPKTVKKPSDAPPTKNELAVIKAVYERLLDSTPEGKVLSEDKIGKAIFAQKGVYVDDMKKVNKIALWMKPHIAGLCK